MSCLLGDLAVSASAQVTLRLRATAPGLASASASVGTAVDDPVLTNNAATLSLIVGGGGDIDGDRLQDICEALFGLSVGVNDAVTDPDGDGLSNLEECLNGTHPRGFHQAYFAEGASGGSFFDSTFTIANESTTSAASVTIRLVPEVGPSVTRPLFIGVRGRTTILARDLLGEAPVTFSALIESDVPISSERTMTWDAATHYGSHAEQGLAQPATRWYLAEGSTTEFDLFYLIFNPEATDAIVDIEYLMPGGASVTRTYTAAADRRTTIRVNDVSGVEATDVSAIVTSKCADRRRALDVPRLAGPRVCRGRFERGPDGDGDHLASRGRRDGHLLRHVRADREPGARGRGDRGALPQRRRNRHHQGVHRGAAKPLHDLGGRRRSRASRHRRGDDDRVHQRRGRSSWSARCGGRGRRMRPPWVRPSGPTRTSPPAAR